MNIKEGIEFWELLNSAKNCNGYKAYLKLRSIRSSYSYYFSNKLVLLKNLEKFNENFKNKSRCDVLRWRGQRTLTANICNLIISSQNLVEHLKIKDYPLVYSFFRELRNMITHHQGFELITRTTFEKPDKQYTYQSMAKTGFYNYLVYKLENKPDKKKFNYKRNIDFLKELPEYFNFEIILKEYLDFIDDSYKSHLRKFILNNSKDFKLFTDKIDLVHEKSINIITKSQNRHIKFLLRKAESESG